MNNTFFNQVFSIYSGFVYQFKGTMSDNKSAVQDITEQFAAELNTGLSEIYVTQLPDGSYIVHSFQDLDSEKFTKIADLNYRQPFVLESQDDSSTESQEESQEKSQGELNAS